MVNEPTADIAAPSRTPITREGTAADTARVNSAQETDHGRQLRDGDVETLRGRLTTCPTTAAPASDATAASRSSEMLYAAPPSATRPTTPTHNTAEHADQVSAHSANIRHVRVRVLESS